MAKKTGKNSVELLKDYLSENSDDHFNDIEEKNYIVSTGSLIFDIEVGGGIRPSILRMSGVSGGGKTSASLSILHNFLNEPAGRKGFYIKAEGRLSKEIKERSGVKFVYTPEDWVDGTCYVFKTNIYETAANLVHKLVSNNPEEVSYFFIIDSMDALIPKGDKDKTFEESGKVGAGATISSHFLRKMALPFSVGGHICVMISQVRSTVSINPYAKTDPKLTNASGGNAPLHYSDWIFEVQPRYNADIIADKDGKTIGHWAKIIFRKSPNEKEGNLVKYPIKHKQIGGGSVWKEYELSDLLLSWEMIKKNRAWFQASEDLNSELLENTGFKFPENFQGENSIVSSLEENPRVTEYLFNKFKSLLTQEA